MAYTIEITETFNGEIKCDPIQRLKVTVETVDLVKVFKACTSKPRGRPVKVVKP